MFEDSLQFAYEQIRNTKMNINEEAGEVVYGRGRTNSRYRYRSL